MSIVNFSNSFIQQDKIVFLPKQGTLSHEIPYPGAMQLSDYDFEYDNQSKQITKKFKEKFFDAEQPYVTELYIDTRICKTPDIPIPTKQKVNTQSEHYPYEFIKRAYDKPKEYNINRPIILRSAEIDRNVLRLRYPFWEVKDMELFIQFSTVKSKRSLFIPYVSGKMAALMPKWEEYSHLDLLFNLDNYNFTVLNPAASPEAVNEFLLRSDF